MEPLPGRTDREMQSEPRRSATPTEPPVPLSAKRRRKYSTRYLEFMQDPHSTMTEDTLQPDQTTAPHRRNLRRASRNVSNIKHEASSDPFAPQNAPHSPQHEAVLYDADAENESDARIGRRRWKRRDKAGSPSPRKRRRRPRSKRGAGFHSLGLQDKQTNPPPSTDLRDNEETLPHTRKRSKFGPNALENGAAVYHAEPDVPGIKLWDHEEKAFVQEKVAPSALAQTLRDNGNYAVYVGQDSTRIKYPGDLLGLAKPHHQNPWMIELRKPPAERRIMIIDPKTPKLLGPRACPSSDELKQFLDGLENEQSTPTRRRVFNAHYTDSYGFTWDQWRLLFPTPSHASNALTAAPLPRKAAPLPRKAAPLPHKAAPMPHKAAPLPHKAAPLPHRAPPHLPTRPTHPRPAPPAPPVASVARPPRLSRQKKVVRYAEPDSDPGELTPSDSHRSEGEESGVSDEPLSPHPSLVLSSSHSASIQHGLNLHAKSESEYNERNKHPDIYREMFPTSSSEAERIGPEGHLSQSVSEEDSDSDSGEEAPKESEDKDESVIKFVSPASILALNKFSSLTLKRRYMLNEGNGSESISSDSSTDKHFESFQVRDDVCPDEAREQTQEPLRLQLVNSLGCDPHPRSGKSQQGQPNAGALLTLPLRSETKAPGACEKNHTVTAPLSTNEHARKQAEASRALLQSDIPSKASSDLPLLDQESEEVEAYGKVGNAERPLDADTEKPSKNDHANCSKTHSNTKTLIGTNENLETHLTLKKDDREAHGLLATRRSSHRLISPPDQHRETSGTDSSYRPSARTKLFTDSPLVETAEEEDVAHPQRSVTLKRRNAHALRQGEHRVRATHPLRPSCASRLASEEVYTWDYSSKTRSETVVPLATALKICAKSDSMMIYDGQDLKKNDARYREIWTDTQAWISRKGTKPTTSRRVRVWDHCTGKLEQFCFSPNVGEIEGWLRDNPTNSLFRPSLLMQYERQRPSSESKSPESAVKSRISQAIEDQVLRRIRNLRITELSCGSQNDVVLWNILKQRCEPPKNFASKAHLTRFLFSNPALELPSGQDKVALVEHSSESKLISVTGKCPAHLVCFWDTVLKRRHHPLPRHQADMISTVQKYISSERQLEIYTGQDLPEAESIVEMIQARNHASAHFSWDTLAPCGILVQTHIYSQGWLPKHIERQESAVHAAFWSKSRKLLVVEALDCHLMSIDEYLKTFEDLELYVGQDKSEEVRKQLQEWFHVLTFEPHHDPRISSPALLRAGLIPLKFRAIRFTSGEEFRPARKLSKRQRGRYVEPSPENPEEHSADRGNHSSSKRQRLSLRIHGRSDEARINRVNPSSSLPDKAVREDDTSVPTMATRSTSQDAASFEEEHIDRSEGSQCSPAPSSSAVDTDHSESESECDTAVCTDGDASMPSAEYHQDAEGHVRSATRSVKRMISVIREAGPKVLKRELIRDKRQNLREQLILEVESVADLLKLAKDFNSRDFAAMANELCEELQLLDVHGCFSCSPDLGYTPDDLSNIREDLDAGRICTSLDVIRKFHDVCAGLVHFHNGSLLHGQAALLQHHGEEVIARFEKSHSDVIKKEQQMLRVFRICERAKQIGFRTGSRSGKTRESASMHSLGSSEPKLRVSSCQPEVTFLNYRDEKGNSVMGKRPSVRVFGFTIDTKALEQKIGNVRPCHVCRREVRLSQADSLRCSNRVFNLCEEIVCKECLEAIFSLEHDEFRILRDAENWFCVHCRGLCASGSYCTQLQGEQIVEGSDRMFQVRLVWHYVKEDTESVFAVIAKRHRNGEYDPFPDTLPEDNVELVQDTSRQFFFADFDLPMGAYRCQVMMNKSWVAGTTFHVLPPEHNSDTAYLHPQLKTAPYQPVSYQRGPHSCCAQFPPDLASRATPRGPRIRWHDIRKGQAYPVHAIRDESKGDGGTLVKECSRTEGYDWRRAKRHATSQWIPELRLPDEPHQPLQEDRKRLIFCAIDSKRAHSFALQGPPVPQVGISHKNFQIMLNTFRYKEMLKSLWSIVTGRSTIHGIGLYTLTGYKKGDFVIEYAGDLIRTPLADIREARYDAAGLGTYLFKINDEHIVDATVQSNRARFTNHSCDPNMVADILHVEGRDLIVLRATREIPRFTELTFDYKFPYEEAKLQCLCNSWNCVGVMN